MNSHAGRIKRFQDHNLLQGFPVDDRPWLMRGLAR